MKMLQPTRSIRNLEVPTCFEIWFLPSPKNNKAQFSRLISGTGGSKDAAEQIDKKSKNAIMARGLGSYFFRMAPKIETPGLDLGAGGPNATSKQIGLKPKNAGMASDLGPHFSRMVPKLKCSGQL